MKLKDAVLNVFAPPLNKLGFELKEDNPKHYCFSNDSTGIDVTITVPPIYPFEVVNEYLSNVEQKQQNNFYIEKNIYVLMEYSARLLEGGYVNLTPHMFESCMGINGGCIFCISKELGEKSAQAIQETVSVVIPYMERLSKRYVIPDCSRELSEMFSSTMFISHYDTLARKVIEQFGIPDDYSLGYRKIEPALLNLRGEREEEWKNIFFQNPDYIAGFAAYLAKCIEKTAVTTEWFLETTPEIQTSEGIVESRKMLYFSANYENDTQSDFNLLQIICDLWNYYPHVKCRHIDSIIERT